MSTKNVPIKDLKQGSYVMVDDEACRVVGITKSKPGKHGSTKARVEAMGLTDNKRHYILKPVDALVEVPIIDKRKAQVISISGDIVQLMDLTDYSTFESTIPEEFKGKLDSGKEIVYWKIGNTILIREVV